MRKLFFITVIFGLILFGVNGKALSLRLPQGLEEYFKSLGPTAIPEPTTTVKSEENEPKSCWQDFSLCYSALYNLIAEHDINRK